MTNNFRQFETEIGGRKVIVETGKYAEQANGSCIVRCGDTVVMVNVTMSDAPRDGMDFFPLQVDYEEKMYAVGKIPGGFKKREGRASDKAILTSRLIDRPLRPLFPKGLYNDVVVIATALSVDTNIPPEPFAMLGSSIALSISDIPWAGPTGSVQVGLVDGEYVINPDLSTTVRVNNKNVKSVLITVPLSTLKTLEPYAFKSIAICKFIQSDGEENRSISNPDSLTDGDVITQSRLTAGEFYFSSNGIVKFISVSQVDATSAVDGSAITKEVYDVQYYAVAAGAYSSTNFSVGESYAYMIIKYGSFYSQLKFMENDVIRYEMMEGSVYFVDNIVLGIVSKIHTNAFTDIDTDTVTIEMYSYSNNYYNDTWLDIEKVKQQNSSIFEEGWLNGLANSSNTMMENITTSQDSLS